MLPSRLRWALAALLCAMLSVAPAPAQTKAKAKSTSLKPEPLQLLPGQALSDRALTQRPGVIAGARGWTLETRHHRGPVYAVAFSPDDKLFATAGHDGTIRIWEAASGRLAHALLGHNYAVLSLTWSPDGTYLATAGYGDGTVRVWDPHTGQPLRKFVMEKGGPAVVTWSPDGQTLAGAGGASGYVWLFDVSSDRGAIAIETGNPISAITWSPDSRTLAVCANRLPIRLLERNNRLGQNSVGEPTESALNAIWSLDGKTLISGTASEVKFWDVSVGKLLGKSAGAGAALALSADGKSVSACYNNGTLSRWDIATQKSGPPFPTGSYAYILHRLPQSGMLAALTYSTLTCWKDGNATPERTYELGGQTPAIFTPGRPIVTGIGEKSLALWQSAAGGKRLATLDGHSAAINAVAWSKSGKHLASGGSDGRVIIWDASGKRAVTSAENAGVVLSLSWSPDGKFIASGAADQSVSIWELATGARQHKLDGHKAAVHALAWSPAGKLLAAGGIGKPVILWSPETGQQVQQLKDFPAGYTLCWGPAGKYLATGAPSDTLRYWTAAGAVPPQVGVKDPNNPAINLLAWAPNGEVLAACWPSGATVCLYGVKSAQLLQNLPNWAAVQNICWSTKGETLVAGCTDRTVRFWDGVSGQLRGMLIGDSTGIIATNPEGHYRAEPASEAELIFVVQTEKGQDLLPSARFAAKYKWKNQPAAVKLTAN